MATKLLGYYALALFVHLTCEAAIQKLKTINDLKGIQFDQSVPRRGYKLLHWFANCVDVSHKEVQLTFDPNSDFGSHHYGNYEGLLPKLPAGCHYFTVGNIYEAGAAGLPDNVRDDSDNRVRIIFRVRGEIIDQVYLTQHYDNSPDSSYDPDHTYEISRRLLMELRQRSADDLEQHDRSDGESEGSSIQVTLPDSDPPGWRPRETTHSKRGIKWAIVFVLLIIAIVLFLWWGGKI